MHIYKTVRGLQNRLDQLKKEGKTIGFVPTMGALHQGHMSLVNSANKKADITVVSIFVNPTQFNEKSDLDKYPRTLEKDAALLKSNHCDIIFAPSETQIYPKDGLPKVGLDITHLIQSMEGPNRPGHFEGVVQVVHRLLSIVGPDYLFMGQKDFQQFTIIGHMLKKLKLKTKLIVCEIIREKDGLAMSSRNVRLTPAIRKKCSLLYETLTWCKANLNKYSIKTLEKKALEKLSQKPFKTEYYKIVDGYDLMPISDISNHKYIVACTAVWAGKVRLIDNMILKNVSSNKK